MASGGYLSRRRRGSEPVGAGASPENNKSKRAKGRGKTHLEEVGVFGRERRAEQGHRRGRREEDGRRRRQHVQIARDRIDVRV